MTELRERLEDFQHHAEAAKRAPLMQKGAYIDDALDSLGELLEALVDQSEGEQG